MKVKAIVSAVLYALAEMQGGRRTRELVLEFGAGRGFFLRMPT